MVGCYNVFKNVAKVARWPKFLSSSSSDWLVQICVSFTMIFAQTVAFSTEHSETAHRFFYRFEVS